MAQSTTAAPDFQTPRSFLDPRGFTRNLIERRSWFIGFILLDVLVIYAILTSPVLMEAWNYIWPGITITVQMTVVSFVLATIIGLIIALLRISKNVLIYNVGNLLRRTVSRPAAARHHPDFLVRAQAQPSSTSSHRYPGAR